jgi:hypothetical protein
MWGNRHISREAKLSLVDILDVRPVHVEEMKQWQQISLYKAVAESFGIFFSLGWTNLAWSWHKLLYGLGLRTDGVE